ncbi:MAG: HAD hydrolase family protein, partial [Clostridia bacterium]|nr:HAD hydrolase family protein [Clostridia bacterium]
ADIGYAVGNATDSLKAVADRVTVNVREHAIAKIIEELE